MVRDGYPLQESLLPQPVPTDFVDHVFLTPDDCRLDIRIWPAPLPRRHHSPWIFWTHGGAFCAGTHYAPPSWVIPAFRKRGYHIVSTAYRLVPHADMATIIHDSVNGFEWCRRKLPLILGDDIDIDAFAIGGDSAGGAIATLLGLTLRSSPRAVIDVYGVTDFVHQHRFSKPSSLWVQRWGSRYSAADNLRAIATSKLSDAITITPFGWEINNVAEDTTRRRWACDNFAYTPQVEFQTQLLDFVCSRGLMSSVLLRLDGLAPDEARTVKLKAWSPFHLLEQVPKYPPTAFLHGEEDGAVPIEQSQQMAHRLRQMGTPVWESYEPGVPHAFDQIYVASSAR